MKNKTITLEDLEPLKEAYKKAEADGKEEFIYNGRTLVTEFAKYVIEYLETRKWPARR